MNNLVVGADMGGAARPLLFLGAGLVLMGGMAAGLFAGEYTLTLALGALTATLVGLAFMMQADTDITGHQRAPLGQDARSGGQSSEMVNPASLPDPMDQNFDMPL